MLFGRFVELCVVSAVGLDLNRHVPFSFFVDD